MKIAKKQQWCLITLFLMGLWTAGNRVKADVPPAPAALVTPDFGRPHGIFFVGDPVTVTLKGAGATRYEVRNYDGAVVDKGDIAAPFALKVTDPGWYKLYLYKGPGDTDGAGSATFAIFRKDANFPDIPSDHPESEQALRGAAGIGPAKLVVDSSHPVAAIKLLDAEIALAKKYYLPYDAARKRVLIVSVPDGTFNSDGMQKIVSHCKSDVTYWELSTNPALVSGADYAVKELPIFAGVVKGVDPGLKVLGPGAITLRSSDQAWIEDFLKADGAKSLDGFSFAGDDAVVGDLWLTRTALTQLTVLLAPYKANTLEKWQTGKGYSAVIGTEYAPHVQGRWTMLQMLAYEQSGIPKEHNILLNDKAGGWMNSDGSLNPAAVLMRVWSEEIGGKTFTQALDLGQQGNELYDADLFTGGDKRVIAFLSAGSTDHHVMLRVKGTTSLHTVSAIGVAQDIPVVNGEAALLVPLLPVYVELSPGQTADAEPMDWSPNFALVPEVVAEADGDSAYPGDPTMGNSPGKVNNGVFESWYAAPDKDAHPWTSNVTAFPAALTLTWPEPTVMDRVIVYAAPPWQQQGTLLDYELQYDKNGQWVTLEHVIEPVTVVKAITSATGTTLDNYASDRWVFQHHFPAVTTRRLRLLVHDVTWGGDPTEEASKAGGQGGQHQMTLREIQVFGPSVNGLRGEYFTGKDFDFKFLTRTDSTVNFPDWWTAQPSLNHNPFSVRWTGSVRPRYSEEYTFFTDADDGARLWIDGKMLVDNWADHGSTENGGKIILQANRVYSIQMEYYENGVGPAGVKLGWVSASQPRQIVPAARLLSPPVSKLLSAKHGGLPRRLAHTKKRHKK